MSAAKPSMTNRDRLLSTLRDQRARIGAREYSRAQAPELFDLGKAADQAPRGRRTFTFQGVRFSMKFGFRRYVLDPETGETLTAGGFLA